MRKALLLSIIALLLTSQATEAQTHRRASGTTHRSNSASHTTTRRSQAPPLVPIDTSASTVSDAQFANVVALFLRLASLPPKSEYETWATYAQRVNSSDTWYALPITCRWTGTRIFSYDAEAGKVRVYLPTVFGGSHLSALNVACLDTPRGSFIGSNAFGVKRRIRVTDIAEYGIRNSRESWGFISGTAEWSMSGPEAAAVVPNLIAFLVVHPAGGEGVPLVDHESDVSEATIDAPTQENYDITLIGVDGAWLWAMDRVTKRIVFKTDLLTRPY